MGCLENLMVKAVFLFSTEKKEYRFQKTSLFVSLKIQLFSVFRSKSVRHPFHHQRGISEGLERVQREISHICHIDVTYMLHIYHIFI